METRGLTLNKNAMMETMFKLITASLVKKLFVGMDLLRKEKRNVMMKTLKMGIDVLRIVLLKNAAITGLISRSNVMMAMRITLMPASTVYLPSAGIILSKMERKNAMMAIKMTKMNVLTIASKTNVEIIERIRGSSVMMATIKVMMHA